MGRNFHLYGCNAVVKQRIEEQADAFFLLRRSGNSSARTLEAYLQRPEFDKFATRIVEDASSFDFAVHIRNFQKEEQVGVERITVTERCIETLTNLFNDVMEANPDIQELLWDNHIQNPSPHRIMYAMTHDPISSHEIFGRALSAGEFTPPLHTKQKITIDGEKMLIELQEVKPMLLYSANFCGDPSTELWICKSQEAVTVDGATLVVDGRIELQMGRQCHIGNVLKRAIRCMGSYLEKMQAKRG